MAEAEKLSRQHYIPQFLLRNFSYKDQKKDIFRLNCRTGKIEKRPIQDTACGDGANPRKQIWGEEYEEFSGRRIEATLAKIVRKCISETRIYKNFRNFRTYRPQLEKTEIQSLLTGLFWIFFNQNPLRILENKYTSEKGEIINPGISLGAKGQPEYSRAKFRNYMNRLTAKETGLAGSILIASAPVGEHFIMPNCFAIDFPHLERRKNSLSFQKRLRVEMLKAESRLEQDLLTQKCLIEGLDSHELLVFPLSPHRALFLFHNNARKTGYITHFYNSINIHQLNAQAIACSWLDTPFYVYDGHKAKLKEYYDFARKSQNGRQAILEYPFFA